MAHAKDSRKSRPRSARPTQAVRIRYAVAGLGYITQTAVLPAFANARRNSGLGALFSNDATPMSTPRR